MKENMNYHTVDELREQCKQLDDAGQRIFVRELILETHVALNNHFVEEAPVKKQMEKIHDAMFRCQENGDPSIVAALFDRETGLLSQSRMICKIAKWSGAGIALAFSTIVSAGVVSIGKTLGWW
jgi:hypothetical protein